MRFIIHDPQLETLSVNSNEEKSEREREREKRQRLPRAHDKTLKQRKAKLYSRNFQTLDPEIPSATMKIKTEAAKNPPR